MTTKEARVTRRDRKEAWPFVSRNSIAGQDQEGFFAGKYDDANVVQAFARHRAAEAERCAQIAEACFGDKPGTWFREARQFIASAIRSGDHYGEGQ